MIYVVKQTVTMLASPLVVAALGMVVALVLRGLGRRRVATWLAGGALAIGYLGAIEPTADALLRPLESQYPPLRDQAIPRDLRFIVVLGSSYQPRDDIPVTAALSENGLVRAVEGVRLARLRPGALLVLSGGATPGYIPGAHGYRALALSLGIDGASIRVLDSPRDTTDEAQAIAGFLGDAPFVVVTSAYHMPRAMRLMRSQGMHAVAAPTGHLVDRGRQWGWRALLPRAAGLSKTEYALHEYLGLAVLAMSGR